MTRRLECDRIQRRHRFTLGETWLYNLLLPDHRLRRAQSSRPAVSKTFRSAGLLSSAGKSVKRSRYALKRCPKGDRHNSQQVFYRGES